MKYRKSTESDPSPAKEVEVVKGLEVLGGSHLGLEGRVTTGTTQEEGKAEVKVGTRIEGEGIKAGVEATALKDQNQEGINTPKNSNQEEDPQKRVEILAWTQIMQDRQIVQHSIKIHFMKTRPGPLEI